ncbi:hypothetical protein P8452_52316 [Trifolium repens]|nr:hypothetical protein P8452_52316 [Trifolium repens]
MRDPLVKKSLLNPNSRQSLAPISIALALAQSLLLSLQSLFLSRLIALTEGSVKRIEVRIKAHGTLTELTITNRRSLLRIEAQGASAKDEINVACFHPFPGGGKHVLSVEKKQIKAVLNSIEAPFFCSTRFPIQIRAGSGSTHLLESGTVLPIKIHRDEESGNILNLVFVWAEDGMDLKVDVPVVFRGEDACPGLKKDQ